MKKVVLLMFACCWSILLTAGDVMPEKALQQAADFLNQRAATGSRRASVTSQQLTMVSRISDLYVFNVANNGGFVIVSNDDTTTPILGYSDSGSIDPDNMPENMKAWLQGYADEIAWAKEHNVTKIVYDSPYAKTNATRRSGTAVKNPIAPLVKTHWDQTSPYNNNCPEYTEGYKAATGCVATAMAQVMKYHGYANMLTDEIPGYTTLSYGISVAALPRTTFDWDDMQLNYTGSETAEQNAAVAKLMQYCGAAVEMDYGPESGASLSILADVMKYCFGYNATTQTAARSVYSYVEWIEIIYHELKQGRPVLYGGQSSGGGHEFVCDGYQGEDFFHINWGWGGQSDDYFKLSVLNPYEQGIGGSSSTDGYYYGQVAVIGLQKPSDEGTVLDIEPHNIDLTCSSFSCVDEAAVGKEVDITLNVSNNTNQDFSGDIYVGIRYGDSEPYDFGLLAGSLFEIPAYGTKVCTVKATFKGEGTYNLVFFYPNQYGTNSTDGQVKKTITITAGGGGLPTSDDVDLTSSVKSIENANAGKTEVYGTANDKDINAVITINNPSATTNYYGTYVVFMRSVAYPNDCYYYYWRNIWIPAGGSYDFMFTAPSYPFLDYQFSTFYQKAGALTSETNIGNSFSFTPGIFTYTADGIKTATKAAGTIYNAPANTLAVDLSGTGITSVTSFEPNCLFIIGDGDAAPLGSGNIVAKSGSTYTATNIILTDGNGFYSPVDFTATKIEFTYANDRWANGTNGWNTIMLPYDVTSVTADDTPIDWFHSSTDEGKNFWLKEFSSDDGSNVYFDYVSGSMEANTPYIVAFPDNTWGAAWDMSGKTIKFIGENVIVSKGGTVSSITGANYRFIGNTVQDNTANIYCINASGSAFELVPSAGCSPFRAYFKSGIFDHSVTSLSIGGGTVTGISKIKDVRSKKDDIYYDLNGRRVLYPKKGVYILNGNKVIIK